MKANHRSALNALAALALAFAAGCVAGAPRLPPATVAESTEPAPPPPPAAPPQVQLTPPEEPVPLTPPPQAAKRVAVMVTERLEGSTDPRRDHESEAILAEALLSARGDLEIEVVKRGVYDDILKRDYDSLVHQGLNGNAEVLSNLLKAGVDYLAIAEIGGSQMIREIGGGRTVSDRSHVQAGVQVVQTDDATVLVSANGEAHEASYRDARSRALKEAAQRVVEALRNLPKSPPIRAVTMTVDGLAKFEEAERILSKLRGIDGVVWSRDLRFSAGAGPAGGVARFEIGYRGVPEELRARVQTLDAGPRLEVTRVEGSRWNLHAVPGTSPASPSQPVPETKKDAQQ